MMFITHGVSNGLVLVILFGTALFACVASLSSQVSGKTTVTSTSKISHTSLS